ncbi:MAG: D-aminoacyl-tRNA deacylase [Endomicrobia bacterium]|nr:D-aminoacyl-tRNA deacylase [Endomicrobiia bacterium]
MRAVVQRVNYASVRYETTKEEISKGLVVFIGISKLDTYKNIQYIAKKVANLRIFENEKGKMDKSIMDINGEILVVSEFTLYGNCSSGNRPDFTEAAPPENAEKLYNEFIKELSKYLPFEKIKTGKFRTNMLVEIHNDGPVTILLEG